jgi:copper resistance protein D
MDEALCVCRFVQFTAAMLIFGTAAFRVYALSDGDPRAASSILARFDGCFGRVMLIGSLVALISGVALLLCQAAAMAGSAAAMIEFAAVGAVLFDTWFGRVWLLHLLLAAMLVGACLGRHPKWPTLALLSLALLASLGWIGHATIGDGAMRIAHQLNQTGHLLAGGLWLGGLVPLAWVLRHCEIFPARDALQSFSHMGYWAVAVLAITGAINSVFLVGSLGAMLGTPYGRLLALKGPVVPCDGRGRLDQPLPARAPNFCRPRHAANTGPYRGPRTKLGDCSACHRQHPRHLAPGALRALKLQGPTTSRSPESDPALVSVTPHRGHGLLSF